MSKCERQLASSVVDGLMLGINQGTISGLGVDKTIEDFVFHHGLGYCPRVIE